MLFRPHTRVVWGTGLKVLLWGLVFRLVCASQKNIAIPKCRSRTGHQPHRLTCKMAQNDLRAMLRARHSRRHYTRICSIYKCVCMCVCVLYTLQHKEVEWFICVVGLTL